MLEPAAVVSGSKGTTSAVLTGHFYQAGETYLVMEAYGDVSGHFRGLLTDECDIVVVGVVLSDELIAGRCPKKTVRQVDDVPEARWHELTDVQKRRFIECVAEDDRLTFGYATFTRDTLHSMANYHYLYQDASVPTAWDLALIGYTYGEVLFEHDAHEENVMMFELDRVASKKQGEAIVEHLRQFVQNVNPCLKGSRQSTGIQAADCLAGAVADDFKYDTGWMDELRELNITDCGNAALVQLENDLDDYSS